MQTIAEENILDVAINSGKRLTGTAERTLGEIVLKDLRKAAILKNYGLDFCCGGKKTLKVACAEKGLDVADIEKQLQQPGTNSATRPLPYDEWSPAFLADFIINTHHSYVRKTLPDLRQYAAKVGGVHGKQHQELYRILELVEAVNAELVAHMAKEEKILFPYIKQLENAANNSQPLDAPFGTVQNPINMMEMEHELVGKSLEEIRRISNNYTVPQDGCATYRILYKLLDEFEDDLHTHIHLENNILFPKALKLEKR